MSAIGTGVLLLRAGPIPTFSLRKVFLNTSLCRATVFLCGHCFGHHRSAHAGTISGTAYCDIATNSSGQGSGNAISTPTLGTLQSAINASAGTCATFTASAINFNTGYGNPGTSLNSFLNTQSGNVLSSTYFATPAKKES